MIDAERELNALAKILPFYEARAAALEPSIGRRAPNSGRPDHIDDSPQEIAMGMRAMGRLSAVEWTLRLVLVFAYLMTGKEIREKWSSGASGEDRWAGFDIRIALVFATPGQRLTWLLNPAKSQARDAMRNAGEALRRAALAAYAAITDIPRTDGHWLVQARDEISRRIKDADRAQREITRVREQNRVTGSTPALPSRKERRAHLQRKQAGEAKEAGEAMDSGERGNHYPS